MHSRAATIKSWILFSLGFWVVVLARSQGLKEEVLRTLHDLPHPAGVEDFQAVTHLPCLNQGKTWICWSFATCSFVESEMARLKCQPVRLSVLYSPYCQYLEKTRRFVRTKGDSRFNPGDLFTGVMETCQHYGALPASVYGPESALKNLDHRRLDSELEHLMRDYKRRGKWDELSAVTQVRRILNRHLGQPPEAFSYNGKRYTPEQFAAEVVRLPWHEYLLLTSFESAPFYSLTELKVPDNWGHNTNYLNLPLPDFYETLKSALQNGFSVAVSMDNTEPSYQTTGRYCVIPDSDSPAGLINQGAREVRFQDGRTTDDHAIQIIGYSRCGGEDWVLAKDSAKPAWRNGNQGNLFLHESYVKLKVLAFIVHRDAVPEKIRAAQPVKAL